MTDKINTIRFREDNLLNYKDLILLSKSKNIEKRMELLANSLKVIPEITPEIFNIIEEIVNKLKIENVSIECYIYNNQEMNASCFSLKDDVNIILILNSGLVNRMRKEELSFVIGHEIGHYLMGHLNYAKENINENYILELNFDRLSQAQEISADRIGFICSGSIENSLRAIIKTVSGLDDNFITMNLHSYLHQLNELNYNKIFDDFSSTHPIFPVRAKALMLFSMSDTYYDWSGNIKKAPLSIDRVEKRITEDLELTTLKFETETSKELMDKFKLWFFVKSFNENGIIDEDETNFLITNFGNDLTQKILSYVKNNPSGVSNKYLEAKSNIEFVSKAHMNKILLEMEEMINTYFDKHEVTKYFENFKKHYR